MSLSTLFTGIADAIREKDGSTEPIVANDFPARIQAIPTGSQPGTPLDPVQVYNSTRPPDWLPVPEPKDNEIYLLLHIPDGLSSEISFIITGASCYVECGTIQGNEFIVQETFQAVSNRRFSKNLSSDNYAGLTSDGMKQVMIRIRSASGTGKITAYRQKMSSSIPDFSNWNIVEIKAKLPNVSEFSVGDSNSILALAKLRYFSLIGQNSISTKLANMFENCTSLKAVPYLDTSNITNFEGMFGYCKSLIKTPAIDTSKGTNLSNIFSYCNNLTIISPINISAWTSGGYIAYNSPSIESILFYPTVNEWVGVNINLLSMRLSHQALINLFNSLPSVTGTPTLDISNNPGVSELTDSEKAIATGKNWTLTL